MYSVRRFYLSYLFKYIIDLKLIKWQYFILNFYNFINCCVIDKKIVREKTNTNNPPVVYFINAITSIHLSIIS